ncbi:hypothetical protein ABFA07_014394 [Porites harrisoni]
MAAFKLQLHFSFSRSSLHGGKEIVYSRNDHVGPRYNCTIIFEAVGCFSKQFFVTPQVNRRGRKREDVTSEMTDSRSIKMSTF